MYKIARVLLIYKPIRILDLATFLAKMDALVFMRTFKIGFLFAAGQYDRKKICLPAMFLLARIMLRKDLSMSFVKNLFALSKTSVCVIFKIVCVTLYQTSNYISR